MQSMNLTASNVRTRCKQSNEQKMAPECNAYCLHSKPFQSFNTAEVHMATEPCHRYAMHFFNQIHTLTLMRCI